MMGERKETRDPDSLMERSKLRTVKTCWNCKHAKESDVALIECTHPERVTIRGGLDQFGPGVPALILYSAFPDPCDICGLWEGGVGWNDYVGQQEGTVAE